MASIVHLSRRFVGSLCPGGPPSDETEWATVQLLETEVDLWRAMSGPDRRHSVQVARRVERALGDEAPRPVLAAALLHDVGKKVSGLGTYGRVVATLSAMVVGHEFALHWSKGRGFIRRVGLYLRHDELGGDLLELAGSDPVTVAWAREHHWPEAMWTLPPHLAHALKDADDD
ncbi:MAG: HD domain-containing protein [Acidimicrobiia bacterium]|nr:HD domain-containing protein [Acidimicrobiia bacterium]